ncbi:hypothetical protein LQW54_006759 [Pestalotiopsis sp. IQ-011]
MPRNKIWGGEWQQRGNKKLTRFRYSDTEEQKLLAAAIASESLDQAKQLLQQGVRLNCIHYTEISKCRSLETLKLLAEFDFPFHTEGPEMIIDNFDSQDLVDFFLDHGVDINATGEFVTWDNGVLRYVRPYAHVPKGCTVFLNHAALKGDLEMFDHLVSRGADPARSNALHFAARHENQDLATITSIMRHLIEKHGFDIDARDHTGGIPVERTYPVNSSDQPTEPVRWAAYHDKPASLQALINLGASPAPAVYDAATKNHIECLQILLKTGVDASEALALAAKRNYIQAAQLTLEYGATARQALERRPRLRGTNRDPYSLRVCAEMAELLDRSEHYTSSWRKTCL